jgi:SRSO17 transposase
MIKPLSVSPDAGSEVRFQAYISALSEEIGHADRIDPLRRYCTGLLLPGERKSIEPMAARLDPRHVQATHQSLHHFVAKAPWDDAAVLTAVREQVLPALTRHGPITAWILDDTGFPKKGTHSVGVARQYCGQLGKQDNCQVAVSLSLANDLASLPVAFDLYLPAEWATDPVRRATATEWVPFGPSRRSRWSRSDARWPRACHPVSCWAMPPMASRPTSARR